MDKGVGVLGFLSQSPDIFLVRKKGDTFLKDGSRTPVLRINLKSSLGEDQHFLT